MRRFSQTLLHQFSQLIRSPFDLKLLTDPALLPQVSKSMQARFRDPHIAYQLKEQLQTYRKSLYQIEQVNKLINQIQREIKQLVKAKKSEEQKAKIAHLDEVKSRQKSMEAELKTLVRRIELGVMQVGNIVQDGTPLSNNEAENQVMSTHTPSQGLKQHQVPYSEICEQFELTDLKRGQKVGGHRGYFLKGPAVKLALAMANYGINFLEQRGYSLYQSPAIINESTLKGSCQLQSIEQDVYKLEGLESYLIATSEQTLAGYYKDEVLSLRSLPIRMAGYSTCFRKQAGAHGKDIHGLFRVHQFEKVEQFCIAHPEQSRQEMSRMMGVSEEFYKSLGIPYRVVNIVSGELNDAAACKLDLEGWYPSQNRYRELVSVSNCTQYQSRLLRVQYRDNESKQLRYPHMLNGTLVAIQRALTCIIENNYQSSHITVPEVLQPYLNSDRIEAPKK